ncbi:conserved hypothetical protein (plasmid) [Borreliella bissettiae DN127]|uniref:Uncharacterized protein n=1 Tax=Borrelia bissettiae (strain DSM 17990 / CIP 109136 / DN127) TaxID=521010 RepID=G0APE4_BORBD|nr:conserved hypothetical protein [Borreliella bissettiae DN127]
MKRLNKIKRKEYCKFLIKTFAIKHNAFEWLGSNILKILKTLMFSY